MASVAPPPIPPSVPPPYPRPPRPRSIAGPLVLIAIGVIFLLGTLRVVELHAILVWFAHYWPVLLILWGVLKLIDHYNAQRVGARSPGIGGGGIVLVVMIVLFGLMATNLARVNWHELRDNMHMDDGDFALFGSNYSFDDQLQQDFPKDASVHVIDDHGAVSISTSDGPRMTILVHKRINAENQEDANKWNTGTRPQITVSGNIVSVNANTQGAGDHSVATDLVISVPRKAPVTISSRRGDVSIMGRDGDVDISNQRGEVSVSDIKGKVTLSLERSSAHISQVSDDVAIQGRANDVSIEDVNGAAHLTGEFMESVKLSKIAKGVTFKSSRTDMELSRLDGDLDLDSGDLRANNLAGPLRLLTREKDINLEGVSGDVRLEDSNGAIELQMNKMGSVQIENRNADIRLSVPDHAPFQVDARARDGEIQTDFSDLKVENSDNQSSATGAVGSAGPHVVLNNEHGTIEIRRHAPVPPAPPAPSISPAPKPPKAPSPAPTVTDN
jgi:DUF4097 and DUF4098 domain-containing protein YvlB